MIPLYTQEEYEKAKSYNMLKFKCEQCGKEFYEPKKWVKHCLNTPSKNGRLRFCSHECDAASRNVGVMCKCEQCGKDVFVLKRYYEQSKTKHFFCSHSCSASYNNTHKKYGTKRSKLEVYLENVLNEKYNNLEIFYNTKEVINSELDIYFPSLKIAFELNGIFHYEPVFGIEKFQKIQENDYSKAQKCKECGIVLYTINISELKYFKEKNTKKYVDIIFSIIDQHIAKISQDNLFIDCAT